MDCDIQLRMDSKFSFNVKFLGFVLDDKLFPSKLVQCVQALSISSLKSIPSDTPFRKNHKLIQRVLILTRLVIRFMGCPTFSFKNYNGQ